MQWAPPAARQVRFDELAPTDRPEILAAYLQAVRKRSSAAAYAKQARPLRIWKACLTPPGCKACFPFVRNEVRAMRTARDLSQQGLAERLGVSRQTINAIEQGRYDPSLPLAIRIARFFGQQVEQVFHVDGD